MDGYPWVGEPNFQIPQKSFFGESRPKAQSCCNPLFLDHPDFLEAKFYLIGLTQKLEASAEPQWFML
jgi:hypothetical protein